jgi:UDP-N-acetylglucosamine 2-epimerase
MRSAACLAGNSSSGIREGAYIGTPVVNIGTRQVGRERGPNVIDVPYHKDAIVDAIVTQVRHGRYKTSDTYGDGKAGERIAEIFAGLGDVDVQKRITY